MDREKTPKSHGPWKAMKIPTFLVRVKAVSECGRSKKKTVLPLASKLLHRLGRSLETIVYRKPTHTDRYLHCTQLSPNHLDSAAQEGCLLIPSSNVSTTSLLKRRETPGDEARRSRKEGLAVSSCSDDHTTKPSAVSSVMATQLSYQSFHKKNVEEMHRKSKLIRLTLHRNNYKRVEQLHMNSLPCRTIDGEILPGHWSDPSSSLQGHTVMKPKQSKQSLVTRAWRKKKTSIDGRLAGVTMVYAISCMDCEKIVVGETNRNMKQTRLPYRSRSCGEISRSRTGSYYMYQGARCTGSPELWWHGESSTIRREVKKQWLSHTIQIKDYESKTAGRRQASRGLKYYNDKD